MQPRVIPNRHICEDQRRNRRKQALGHISSGEGQFGCHPQQGQVHMMLQERSYQPNLTNTAYTGEQTPSFQRALQSTSSKVQGALQQRQRQCHFLRTQD